LFLHWSAVLAQFFQRVRDEFLPAETGIYRHDEHEVDEAVTQIVVEDSTEALGSLARAHVEELRSVGDLDVIAMTGSVGKTTTKDLLLQIMSEDGPTVAPKLSFNNEVGLPLTGLLAPSSLQPLYGSMGK